MNSLDELLERVKAADGPDRELDFALERIALTGDGWEREDCGPFRDPKWIRPLPNGFWFVHGVASRFTASLDAALALVERVMKPNLLEIEGGFSPRRPEEWPAWTIRWYQPDLPVDGKSWWATVETARTPALALLATLLSALLMKEAAEGTHDGSSPKPQDLSARDQ